MVFLLLASSIGHYILSLSSEIQGTSRSLAKTGFGLIDYGKRSAMDVLERLQEKHPQYHVVVYSVLQLVLIYFYS